MGKDGDTEGYDPKDKYLAVPWDFEFGPPAEKRRFSRNPRPIKKENESIKQSIIFNKANGWTWGKIKKWTKENGYKIREPTETDRQYRIKQFSAHGWNGHFETIDEAQGISAYICDTKEEDNGDTSLGESEIEETDYDKLFRGVSDVYADVFKLLFKELSKDEYRELFDNAKAVKASPLKVLALLVSKVVRNTALVDKTVTSITTVIGPSVVDVVKEQSIELNLGLDDVDETAAIERFTQKRMTYYEKIPDTLSDEVMEVLAKGIEEGQSYQEVRNNLLEKREDFTRAGAERIARTELGRSRREAKLIFAEKHADILVKVWKATPGTPKSRGGHRRDSHQALDGKTANIGDPFIVNYSKDNKKYPGAVEEQYPGESEFGINCTCSVNLQKKK